MCGFSPSLSSRPLRNGPNWLKDVENSARMPTHMSRLYIILCRHTEMQADISYWPGPALFGSIFTHSLGSILKVRLFHILGKRTLVLHTVLSLQFSEQPDHSKMLWMGRAVTKATGNCSCRVLSQRRKTQRCLLLSIVADEISMDGTFRGESMQCLHS